MNILLDLETGLNEPQKKHTKLAGDFFFLQIGVNDTTNFTKST